MAESSPQLLQLEDLRVESAAGVLDGLSAQVEAKRVALVGQWPALWALLTGRAQSSRGALLLGGEPVRQQVILGAVGVLDPALSPLPQHSVREWIAAYLRLGGLAQSAALRQTDHTLTRLGLAHLGAYSSERLPETSLYAVRLALALSTEPHTLFVPPPPWTPESMYWDQALLEQVAGQVVLYSACDPGLHPELFFAAGAALLLEPTSAFVSTPRALFERGGRVYRLLALAQQPALVRELQQQGVRICNAENAAELWVELPEMAESSLILHCAWSAQAPLGRMSPLFETRA